jgi:2-polyprenyl-3-methyl-5-hydroxy-6-metoxy-1,4-benzoquinol methylase
MSGQIVQEIKLKEGVIKIHKEENGYFIKLKPFGDNLTNKTECITTYSIELIKKIVEYKGFAGLCDDIQRDQLYSYVQKPLENVIFSHLNKEEFAGKRILDFGCGAGNSTVILGRLFENSKIIGIELSEKNLRLAEIRKEFYKFDHIDFLVSKSGTELPDNIGNFDFIILNAVFEHLLPNERKNIFPLLWNKLNEGGSLIFNETPNRWFPVETHTTEGFPLINYLPDRFVHFLVNKYSKSRGNSNAGWTDLLRSGIRGGSIGEVLKLLNQTNAILLKPHKAGINDRISLFDKSLADERLSPFKRKVLLYALKVFKFVTGVSLVPTLSFVIKKETK